MEAKDIVGTYYIQGSNQEATDTFTYEGTLDLSLDADQRFVARWNIDGHEQLGKGFFKNDILVINFWYLGEDKQVFKGVAVYRCIDTHTLDGFWSEKYGDPRYLGTELCTRITIPAFLN